MCRKGHSAEADTVTPRTKSGFNIPSMHKGNGDTDDQIIEYPASFVIHYPPPKQLGKLKPMAPLHRVPQMESTAKPGGWAGGSKYLWAKGRLYNALHVGF